MTDSDLLPTAERLRIALVTPLLPVPFDATRGRFIHETARSLSKIATVRVFFQTLKYPPLLGLGARTYIYGLAPSRYQLDGCDVEAYTYPGLPVLTRGINGRVASWALTPRLRRFQPDVVLGYWVYPDGYAALLAARALHVPCVIGALGSDIYVRSGVNAWMTRLAIQEADAVVTVSEAMRQDTIRVFGAKPANVHTIVNGFNTSVFAPMDQAAIRGGLGIPSHGKMVVYVGRFVEAKGLRELLAAFGRLAPSDPGLTLAFVGDGGMKDEMLRLVQAAGLETRVHLPGGLSPTGVAAWINAADVLTLPSWSEGYPNVIVEALACGRPVVATNVGGTREIVHSGNGILVPPRDVGLLTEALKSVLSRDWDQRAIAAPMTRTWDDVSVETLAVCAGTLHRDCGR
ncbi:MAG: glycosyltransferase [Acidobacteriota bacterium]